MWKLDCVIFCHIRQVRFFLFFSYQSPPENWRWEINVYEKWVEAQAGVIAWQTSSGVVHWTQCRDLLSIYPHGALGCNVPLIWLLILVLYIIAFSAWCCWLGDRKGVRPVKNWVVGCWHSCLSGARCRLAYGPADATATQYLLLQ